MMREAEMTAYLEQNQDQTLIVLTDVFGEVCAKSIYQSFIKRI